MEEATIDRKEALSLDQIREVLSQASLILLQSEEKRKTDYERFQVEYAKRQVEYEKSRKAEQAEYAKRQAEYAKRQAEYDKRQAEYDKRQAEYEKIRKAKWEAYEKWKAEYVQWRKAEQEAYDKRQEKAERQMEELRQQMRETDRKVKEVSTKYSSQMGHVVEGLMEPSALALFQQAGFDLCKCWKGMKGKRKELGLEMEVDLFLHDTTDAVAVEVKTNCRRDDIDHFIKQMDKFAAVFPEYAGVNVYLAMAAINYDYDSDKYAAEQGVFVIRVSDEAFTLDSAQKENMTYYCLGECKRGKGNCE